MSDGRREQQQPGQELDARIAAEVMGWENNWDNPGGRDFPDMWGVQDFYDGQPVRAANFPPYSEEIAFAFEVVEKMQEKGWTLELNNWARPCGGWYATFKNEPVYDDERISDCADTAPLAICLAALNAVSRSAPPEGTK